MKITLILGAALLTACGASFPTPTQRMADAQSARRSAMELGADKQPDAQLHHKLADEQIARANTLLKDDENRRADFTLIRAKADAELALAMARRQKSQVEAQTAFEQATAQTNANIQTNQGAR